jgi:hypothetical protein
MGVVLGVVSGSRISDRMGIALTGRGVSAYVQLGERRDGCRKQKHG